MVRKKMNLVTGVKYKGVGWINEYGQTFFEAYQKGQKPNNMKLIKENELYSLYESGNYLKISVKIEKNTDKTEMIKNFMAAFKAGCVELKNYEIDE